MTDHFELSTMIGTREISGSAEIRLRNFVIAPSPSSMPSSMLTSITLAPASTCSRATATASSYFSFRISRENFFEPVTLVRSPIMMKLLSGRSVSGSKPLNRISGSMRGRRRGAVLETASAIARMWAGVVPQQPPTMFNQPFSANSPKVRAIISGVSSNPPKAFGKPAFG